MINDLSNCIILIHSYNQWEFRIRRTSISVEMAGTMKKLISYINCVLNIKYWVFYHNFWNLNYIISISRQILKKSGIDHYNQEFLFDVRIFKDIICEIQYEKFYKNCNSLDFKIKIWLFIIWLCLTATILSKINSISTHI